jgi:hypothetical protein
MTDCATGLDLRAWCSHGVRLNNASRFCHRPAGHDGDHCTRYLATEHLTFQVEPKYRSTFPCTGCDHVDYGVRSVFRPSSSDRAVTNDISERWEAMVTAELAYRGYTDEQIAQTKNPRIHGADCEWVHPYGWQCTDENDKPNHPEHDEADEVSGIIGRAFGWI